MPDTMKEHVLRYLRQQAELGMPDIILRSPLKAMPTVPLIEPDGGTATTAVEPSSSPVTTVGTLHTGCSSYDEKRAALAELYHATQNCRKCALGGLRAKMVFGSGNAGAPLMIIGEAPGEDEDRQGLPFVGAAGQLLTKMLAAINLDRKNDVFITNILKCRPPGNRTPSTEEAMACIPILKRQIDIIQPSILLLLGKVAAQELLHTYESLAILRGKKFEYNGIPVVVTYHPAALLRNAQYKAPAWEDLQKLQKMLKELATNH